MKMDWIAQCKRLGRIRTRGPLVHEWVTIPGAPLRFTMITRLNATQTKPWHKCFFFLSKQRNYRLNTIWLVGRFGLKGSISVYIGGLPDRGRKKRKMIDERKYVQITPHAPSASAVCPCPTIIQISRTHRHWRFTQHQYWGLLWK